MAKPNPALGFGASFNVPLTDEQFATLGKIASQFGQIEFLTDNMLVVLSGVKDRTDLGLILAGRQFGSKVALLEAFADLRAAGDVQTAVLAACAALKDVIADRNLAIHGRWGTVDIEGHKHNGAAVAWDDSKPKKILAAADLVGLLARVEIAAAAVKAVLPVMWPKNELDAGPLFMKFN